MKLNGAVINILGDSITEGVGASCMEKRYADVFAREFGVKVNNYGLSGSRFARQRMMTDEPHERDFCMRMPEMDGLEATRLIRSMEKADAKSIPIIALTANAFDEDVQRSMQAGLNAHLSKPVEPEALFRTLESLIMA